MKLWSKEMILLLEEANKEWTLAQMTEVIEAGSCFDLSVCFVDLNTGKVIKLTKDVEQKE